MKTFKRTQKEKVRAILVDKVTLGGIVYALLFYRSTGKFDVVEVKSVENKTISLASPLFKYDVMDLFQSANKLDRIVLSKEKETEFTIEYEQEFEILASGLTTDKGVYMQFVRNIKTGETHYRWVIC